nr:uncharacterized protein LOC129381478 [Dermacentor andersoni]
MSLNAIKNNYRYDKANKAGISYDKGELRTLTLETEQSLREKLCDLKTSQLRMEFSIAVYDIDFDATGPACPALTISGPYRRLQMVHKLRNFFRDRFRKSTHASECKSIKL